MAPTTSTAPSPSGDLLSILLGAIAPELAGGQASIASAGLASQLAPLQYGLENQYSTQNYQNQLAQLGLSQQGLGLQQGYLGQQQQQAGAQYGLTTGTPGNVGGGGLYAELANLQYQYPQQVQGAEANAAASGATNTVGFANQLGSLAEQQKYNTGNLYNQLQQAALGYQGQQQGFAYQGGQLGLQGQGLGLQNQLLGSQYGYNTAMSGLQGALTGAQDQSALLGAIGNQAGLIGQTAAPLGLLQGSTFSLPAQPNVSN